MEVCETARSWRWRDQVRILLEIIGVMLLGLNSGKSVHAQASCLAAEDLQNLTRPQFEPPKETTINVGFISRFVQSFLNTIQPNDFPTGWILTKINSFKNVNSNGILDKEALDYDKGFVICVVIGLLYIVLMPTVGLVFACCRRYGKCGGKMYQKQTATTTSIRRVLYLTALVTTVIIFTGNICMFQSNQNLKVGSDVKKTTKNLRTYLDSIPQQVNQVLSTGNTTIQKVNKNLDGIGDQLGRGIIKSFKVVLDPAQQSVTRLNQETQNIKVQLDRVNSASNQVDSSLGLFQGKMSGLKKEMDQTLSSPSCSKCSEQKSELEKLTPDVTISAPNLKDLQSAVDEIIKSDLPSKFDESNDYFSSIPEKVTTGTKDVVKNSKQQLDDVNKQISDTSDKVQQTTNPMNGLYQVLLKVDKVIPVLNKVEYIRWAVCVVLCCVVLLIVLCNVLGLVLGPLGLSPNTDPGKRSSTANCGGTFLMIGAGLSFLFSWLLMIAVVFMFLVGGHGYTLVCRPWDNLQLLELVDSPIFKEKYKITQTIGLNDNISLTEIFRNCVDNQSLWKTFHLNKKVNLDSISNVSKYTAQVQQYFEKANIHLSSLTLLSPEVKDQLSTFSTKINNFDTTDFRQRMNDVSARNFNTTADKLENLAKVQNDPGIKNSLLNQTMRLRQFQAEFERTILPQIKNLNPTVIGLQSSVKKMNGMVEAVLRNVESSQDLLNKDMAQIIKTEIKAFMDCQLNFLTAYANWAGRMIREEVGRCKPLADAVSNAKVILCDVVGSLNAFWLLLGWCLAFFIPSIIFNIKLAKHYRNMKYSDVFDNHIIMSEITQAHSKSNSEDCM